MRYHDDPRWGASRLGQIEFRAGPNSGTNRWGLYTPHPLGGWLKDGVALPSALAPVREFRPYRWRDPARARNWAQLPPGLIELMQAEAAEAAEEGEPPLELPDSSRPPARGPGRRLDAVPGGRPPAPGPRL